MNTSVTFGLNKLPAGMTVYCPALCEKVVSEFSGLLIFGNILCTMYTVSSILKSFKVFVSVNFDFTCLHGFFLEPNPYY